MFSYDRAQDDPSNLPSAQVCADALVRARGNTGLATERLGISVHTLVTQIASDDSAQARLHRQLKVLLGILSFEMLMDSHLVVSSELAVLEGRDLVALHGVLLAWFSCHLSR
jgi:hypothetical protein